LQFRFSAFPGSKNIQTFQGAIFERDEQLCSLAKLPIPTVSPDINFGNQIQFKSFMNFKRVPTFLEKSDKFTKIPCSLAILEYNFTLTHVYSKFGSYFASGKNDSVIHTQCSWPLRDVGPPNTTTPLIQNW
jgi:hypothetical protein